MLRLQFYPKARTGRLDARHADLRQPRKEFFKAAVINFVFLQVLFFSLYCYLYGSLYQQNQHAHNISIALVDYDNGLIGQSFLAAYHKMKGKTFPTLFLRPPAQYPTPVDIRTAVCHVHYWAAVYIKGGSSSRLASALAAGGSTAASFNKSDVMFFYWNEARYPAVVDSLIQTNIKTIATTAQAQYATNISASNPGIISSPESLSLFADPWHISDLNLQKTVQGPRLVYNTLASVLIFIEEFCFLGIVNGLYTNFRLYNRLYPTRVIMIRIILSAIYALSGSLFATGSLWAFRAGWHENANQFVLNWMNVWLFGHLNFLTLDLFTVWLPPFYVPLALISWVILNITSILVPFELSPGFYRWAYMLPAHSYYQTEINIWSHGCNPKLWYNLPLMFSIEITSLVLSAIGVYRRCHYAKVLEEADEGLRQRRIAAALDALPRSRPGAIETAGAEGSHADPTGTREELEKDEGLEREQTKSSNVYYGPSFGLAYSRSQAR